MKKHSLTIDGHRTSISLEKEFWEALKKIASEADLPIANLVRNIDRSRKCGLSSAIRLFVLSHYQQSF